MLKTLTSDKLKSQSATLSASTTTVLQVEPHKLDPSFGKYAYVLLGMIVEIVANVTSKKAATALTSNDFGKLITSVRFAPKFWGPSPIIDSRIRGADLWHIIEPFMMGERDLLTWVNAKLTTPSLAGADVTADYYARFRISHAPKFWGPDARKRAGLPCFLFDDGDTYEIELGTTTCLVTTDHTVNSVVVNFIPQLALVHPSQLKHDIVLRFNEEKPSKYDFLLGPYRSPPSDVVAAFVAGDQKGLGGDNLDNITKIRIGQSHPERLTRHHMDQMLMEYGCTFIEDTERLTGETGYTGYGLLAGAAQFQLPLIYPTSSYPDGSHVDDVGAEDAGIYCALTGTNSDQLRLVVVTKDRRNDAKLAEFYALRKAAFGV